MRVYGVHSSLYACSREAAAFCLIAFGMAVSTFDMRFFLAGCCTNDRHDSGRVPCGKDPVFVTRFGRGNSQPSDRYGNPDGAPARALRYGEGQAEQE